MTTPMTPTIKLGDKYTIADAATGYLGEGAFGHVYKATDAQNRTIVVKILWRGRNDELAARLTNKPDGSTLKEPSAESIKQVQLEQRIMAMLNDQLGAAAVRIPVVYDLWPSEDKPRALGMEFIDSKVFVPITTEIERRANSSSRAGGQPLISEDQVIAVTTGFLKMLASIHREQQRYLEDAQLKNLCWDQTKNQWRILDWNGTKPLDEGKLLYADPRSRDVWVALSYAYQMLTGVALSDRKLNRPADLASSPRWNALSPNIKRVLSYVLCVAPGSQSYDKLPAALQAEMRGISGSTLIDWICEAIKPEHQIAAGSDTDLRTAQAREALNLFNNNDESALVATLPEANSFPIETFTLAEWRTFLLLKIVQTSRTVRNPQWSLVSGLLNALKSLGDSPASEGLLNDVKTVYDKVPEALKGLVQDIQHEVEVRQQWPYMGQPLSQIDAALNESDVKGLDKAQSILIGVWASSIYQESLIRYVIDGDQPNPSIPDRDAAVDRLKGDAAIIKGQFNLQKEFDQTKVLFEASQFDNALKKWDGLSKKHSSDERHWGLLTVATRQMLAPNTTIGLTDTLALLDRLENIVADLRLRDKEKGKAALTDIGNYKNNAVIGLLSKEPDRAFALWQRMDADLTPEDQQKLVNAATTAILNENIPGPAFDSFARLQTIVKGSSQVSTAELDRVQLVLDLWQDVNGNDLEKIHETSLIKVTGNEALARTPLAQSVIDAAEKLDQQKKNKKLTQYGAIGALAVVVVLILVGAIIVISGSSQSASNSGTQTAIAVAATVTSQAQIAGSTSIALANTQQSSTDVALTKTQSPLETGTAKAQKTIDAADTKTFVANLKLTPTVTHTPTNTLTPSNTWTPTSTATVTVTSTITATPKDTATPTSTPSITWTPAPNTSNTLFSTDSKAQNPFESFIAPSVIYNQPVAIAPDTTKPFFYFYGSSGDHIQLWCSPTTDINVDISTYELCQNPLFSASCKLVASATNQPISCGDPGACIKPSDDPNNIFQLKCPGIYQIVSINGAPPAGIIALCADVRMLKYGLQTFADTDPDLTKNVCWQNSPWLKTTNRYRFFAMPNDKISIGSGAPIKASASVFLTAADSVSKTIIKDTYGYVNFWLDYKDASPNSIITETVTVSNPDAYAIQDTRNIRIRPELRTSNLNLIKDKVTIDNTMGLTVNCNFTGCPVLYNATTSSTFCLVRDPNTLNVGWIITISRCSVAGVKSPAAITAPSSTSTSTRTSSPSPTASPTASPTSSPSPTRTTSPTLTTTSTLTASPTSTNIWVPDLAHTKAP